MARHNVIGGGSARRRRITRRRQVAVDALAEVEGETDADVARAAYEGERAYFPGRAWWWDCSVPSGLPSGAAGRHCAETRRSAFKRIGRALKSFGGFVAGLTHSPRSQSKGDPRKEIARNLSELLHTVGPSEGGGGKGTANDPNMEPYLAKIISDGYAQTRNPQAGDQRS